MLSNSFEIYHFEKESKKTIFMRHRHTKQKWKSMPVRIEWPKCICIIIELYLIYAFDASF